MEKGFYWINTPEGLTIAEFDEQWYMIGSDEGSKILNEKYSIVCKVESNPKELLIKYENWIGDFRTTNAQEEQVNKFLNTIK